MDIHPWTNYEIARLRHEERLVRGRSAMRAAEAREQRSREPEAGGRQRTASWLNLIQRNEVVGDMKPERRAIMRSVLVICFVAIVAGAGVSIASAARIGTGSAWTESKAEQLIEVAHVYSFGVGEVRCPSRAEWDEDWASSFAWAYTNVREDYTVLGPIACKGALGVGSADVPAWQQALGVLVLTHEAFHLRHWRFRRHEGKVECQALANFRDAAQRLGATADGRRSSTLTRWRGTNTR